MKQIKRPWTVIANFIESDSFQCNHKRNAILPLSQQRNNKHRKITGSFSEPHNCNFLLKLQSNDYRHEVELDNNTRKEQQKKKHTAKDP